MKGLTQLILREVGTRRRVFLLAALIALLPFLLPYLPGMKPYDPATLRPTSALALAAGFSVALSLILGGTVIGRDLSERRFGFYFSRPLSGLTVWAGKMTGTLILIIAVALIVLIPAFLVTLLPGADAVRGRTVFMEVFKMPSVGLFLFSVFLLLGLAHAVSILARAQSAWIMAPIAAGVAAASVVWHSAIPLITLGGAYVISSLLLMGGLLVSLFLAGLLQVLLGRADLKRGARVLALVLTGGLLISSSIHAGYSSWIMATEPQDLAYINGAMAGGEGSWVYLTGPVERGGTKYHQSFLFETTSGRWLRTGKPWHGSSSVDFTPDGRRAIWILHESDPLGGNLTNQIWTVDLEEPDSQPEQVLELDEWIRTVALSATGNRLALVTGNDLQVYDLDSGRLLAAARTCQELRYHRIIFSNPDLVRFYRTATRGEVAKLDPGLPEEQTAHGALVIAELDVAQGEFHHLGIIPSGAYGLYGVSWSRDAERMTIQVRDGDTSSIYLHNGRTGERIMQLGQRDRSRSDSAHLLFDGRIVTLQELEDSTNLILYSSEGTEIRTIRIADGLREIEGEVAPGLLALRIISFLRESGIRVQSECYLVDLDTGLCRQLGRDILPVMGSLRGVAGISGAWPSPGSPGSGLYIEDHSSLVRLDLATGERSVVLELHP